MNNPLWKRIRGNAGAFGLEGGCAIALLLTTYPYLPRSKRGEFLTLFLGKTI